jgi:glycosyltransferase involved in cell wall biosynthesis
MKIRKLLAIIHLYPPQHLCGGEMYLHRMLKFMESKGMEARVLLMNAAYYGVESRYTYDGIDVYPNNKDLIVNLCGWADAIVTHLDYTETALHLGSIFKKPVLHLAHNSYPRPEIREADKVQYMVYNSEWVKEPLGYKWPGIVLHPPVDYRKYDTCLDHSKAEAITLINLDHNKGGHILKAIAERMPARKFIGVLGSYSAPANIGQYKNQPPNVEVLGKTPNILDVYRRTRILIMPSEYESWGMTATEASSSGIPVICTETPGLKENMGKAGTYIKNRDDIEAWVNAIHALDDPKKYKSKSEAARKRSRELDPQTELEALYEWIQSAVRFSQSSGPFLRAAI